MDSEEMNQMVSRISSIWTTMLSNKETINSNIPFLRDIKANSDRAKCYENSQLLEQALNIIPVHILYEEAGKKCNTEDELEDQVIKQLLHWFKNDFFKWVDNLPCESCGSSNTIFRGNSQPNKDDLLHQAHVIELYQCNVCQVYSRFPRYSDPSKLLQTKKGRCGEWANCFTLCCQAIGVDARFVMDNADHVWTEIYSNFQNRWIHCDSCEETFDRPLVYSVGWNKKLSYCIAYSPNEVVDVTRRYVKDWKEVLKRRNLANEQQLKDYIHQLCQEKIISIVDEEKKRTIKQRQEDEQIELEKASLRTIVKKDELVGRQSGSLAWRTLRGEQGSCDTGSPLKNSHLFDNIEKQIINQNLTIDKFKLLGSSQHIEKDLLNEACVIRLTPSKPSQAGGAFINDKVDISNGFEIEFGIRMTNDQGGADGLAFVLQANDHPRLGEGGCELGYGGIPNSLAIEFDTYDSSDRCEDPSPNHISVHGKTPSYIGNSAHHDHSLGHTSLIPTLNSGKWIYIQIQFISKDQKNILLIHLKENLSEDYTQVLQIDNVNLYSYLNQQKEVFIGFTASTGGLSQNHDIQLLKITRYL
ncbi:unnamed protein product [Cunninghamella blakesleeana]